jgi:hypothetical protein
MAFETTVMSPFGPEADIANENFIPPIKTPDAAAKIRLSRNLSVPQRSVADRDPALA